MLSNAFTNLIKRQLIVKCYHHKFKNDS